MLRGSSPGNSSTYDRCGNYHLSRIKFTGQVAARVRQYERMESMLLDYKRTTRESDDKDDLSKPCWGGGSIKI